MTSVITHLLYIFYTMSNDKVATPKLEGNGSNWGTYHDRMHLILHLCKLGDHLTLATLTVRTLEWKVAWLHMARCIPFSSFSYLC